MNKILRFRAESGCYALPVANVERVLRPVGLVSLPSPRPGVAGVLDADGELVTVLSLLGAECSYVLVLTAEGRRFGLLVDEVVGVAEPSCDDLTGAPQGQEREMVLGAVAVGEEREVTMMLDVAEIAAVLGP